MSFGTQDLCLEVEVAVDAINGTNLFQACEVFLQESGRCDVKGLSLDELMTMLSSSSELQDQIAFSDCQQPRVAVILCLTVYGFWVDYDGIIRDPSSDLV